ncbi:hypothetical protein N2152v2_001327 [Parachlorella kessleri]
MGPRQAGFARLLLSLLLAAAALAVSAQSPHTGFIRVSQGRFVDANCREFLFSGWNGWKVLDYGANKFSPPGFSSGQEFITDLFKRANSNNLNVLRFFTTGDDDQAVVLMQSPGNFNEYAFQGLDFVLDAADKAGIKLILVPSNLWKPNGGVPQFEQWCGTSNISYTPVSDIDLRTWQMNVTDRLQTPIWWYNSTTCRQQYKDYLAGLVNRRNSINGRLYRDDPTIFAWNLLNEPRCKFCGPQVVTDWYLDMAQFLKGIDPNHMITTGEEGFFSHLSPWEPANPNRGDYKWARWAGQDFVPNHDSPNIDFAVMHLWPDNWGNMTLPFGETWIDAHMQAAASLGKPLVMEEFGKNAAEGDIPAIRDPWFQLVYGKVNDSLSNGGVLRGALFWQWDGYGTGSRDNGSNIRETDTTFTDYIAPFSHRVAAAGDAQHKLAADIVAGCTPATPGAAAAPASTNATVVPPAPEVPNATIVPLVTAAGRRLLRWSSWNAWKTLDYATNKAAPPGYSSGQEFIRDLFKRANSSGLNLLRAFTSGDEDGVVVGWRAQGLDFILDEADKAGIKLVLVPLNLWKPNGGVPQFEKWCGTDQVNTSPVSAVVRSGPLNATERVQTPYWWYINPGCRDMYKDYLRGLVLRRNSINGRLYRDDPTIFAWNLLNEVRLPGTAGRLPGQFCEPQAVTDWYLDMAQFLKSIDPNHMVTTGEEGLFAYTSPYEPVNPYRRGYRWADFTGQDFIADHNSSNIDYAVIHLWPDNWSNQNLTFGRSWIEAHMEAAESLGKPLMLEEFGKNAVETDIATVRDPWFQLVYGMVSDSLRSGGALRGALFWQWEGFGTAPRTDNGSNIRETDTTFTNYIRPFSHRMAAGEGEDGGHTAAATVVPGCIPVAPSTPSLPRPSVLPPNTSVVSAGRRLLLA